MSTCPLCKPTGRALTASLHIDFEWLELGTHFCLSVHGKEIHMLQKCNVFEAVLSRYVVLKRVENKDLGWEVEGR